MTNRPVTFPADGLVSVQVDLPYGYLDIVSSRRADVVVTVAPSNAQRAGDRAAAEKVRVDRTGALISVTGPSNWNPFGAKGSVDILIEVPEASVVKAHVKYGSLRVTGPVGEVQAKIDYGDSSIEACERLALQSGHGEMRIGRVEGDADVTFAYGSVRFDRVRGGLTIKGAHGSVDVDAVGGRADITTASGAIELGTAAGALAVRSAYGGVRVRDLVRGSAQVEASYGTVQLGVRKGSAVWLDASSKYGTVRSDLASDPGPAAGEETLELRVHTAYGDIIVQRAGAAAAPTRQTERTSA